MHNVLTLYFKTPSSKNEMLSYYKKRSYIIEMSSFDYFERNTNILDAPFTKVIINCCIIVVSSVGAVFTP